MKLFKHVSGLWLLSILTLLVSCDDDEVTNPVTDNQDEETISKVILTWTPDNGEDAITTTWFDADGEGEGQPTIDDIELEEEVTYALTIRLENTLGAEVENVTSEILKEDHEHLFFFEFTDSIFTNPTGNGNTDNRNDTIVYKDEDENGLPVGLSTAWTTGEHTEEKGTFKIILKHQPEGLKTATSDITVGGTDVDITFPIKIVEEGDGHSHGDNDDEEVINRVTLTWTPSNAANAVTAVWFDADGEGVGNPTIDEIVLNDNEDYVLSITMANTLGTETEDVTAEILKEDDEHMLFFAFTNDLFSSPTGNGNVDSRADALVYNDKDENDLPVGLATAWKTGAVTTSASTFKILLKHQPDGLKTASSDATVGGTDIDITFPIKIQ